MSLSEGGIRRIVREEMKFLLESIAVQAESIANQYDTGDLETAAMQAINKVAEREAFETAHEWKCPNRMDFYKECTCNPKVIPE